MNEVKIAVAQEIIEGFQNFKKNGTSDILENKSKQVSHLLVPDPDPVRIRIGPLLKSYVFKSLYLISVWMVQISHKIC